MRGRQKQRGFSSPEVALYNVLIFSGYGLVTAAVGGTFYIAAKKNQFLLVPLAIFWLWAWSYTSYWGNGPQKWAWKTAVRACEEEIANLPKQIETDGVMDEAAFLTWRNVENLLRIRRLDFVEIRVRRESSQRTRYLHPSETSQNSLLGVGKIVRFDIGKQGEATCVFPVHTSRIEPNECIRMTLVDEPTARYSVHHSFDNEIIPIAVGNWILLDRTRDVEIARISTSDSSTRAGLGNPATIGEIGKLSDCRAAHVLLFDSLYGNTSERSHRSDS